MTGAPEYVVSVKRWPAYVLAVLVPVAMVLYAVQVVLLLSISDFTGTAPIILFVLVVCSAFLIVGLLMWSLARMVTVIKHPPRLTPSGIQLWLLPTAEYMPVPWPRVMGVRFGTKGISTALFVYVHAPEALANGDPAKVKRIQTTMRRFHGAPFVYPVSGSPRRLDELDRAVRSFTGGRLFLQR